MSEAGKKILCNDLQRLQVWREAGEEGREREKGRAASRCSLERVVRHHRASRWSRSLLAANQAAAAPI